MKKLILTIALLALLVGFAQAGTTVSNLLTYTSVNNTTNNGSAILIGTAYVPTTPIFNIQHAGLYATNDVLVRVQYGLDTNTFTTVYTWNAATTNATDEQILPTGITLYIYARTAITTTNNTSVGSKAILQSP